MRRVVALTTVVSATLALMVAAASAAPPCKHTFTFAFGEEIFLCASTTILWSHERQTFTEFSPTNCGFSDSARGL